jgi:hypothetical protein
LPVVTQVVILIVVLALAEIPWRGTIYQLVKLLIAR